LERKPKIPMGALLRRFEFRHSEVGRAGFVIVRIRPTSTEGCLRAVQQDRWNL
jgi:hypothetical protein